MRLSAIALSCFLFAVNAQQSDVTSKTPEAQASETPAPHISLEQAYAAVKAGRAKAEELGVTVSIVVLEEAKDIRAYEHMDDALYGSTEFAINKAKVAFFFQKDTDSIVYGYGFSRTMPGGVPISDASGKVIGSIGVSGSYLGQVRAIAREVAAALRPLREEKEE